MPTPEDLAARRDEIVSRIAAMAQDFAAMVDSSQGSNADDEHDPEGATIAFERQQLVALLAEAQRRLGDLDLALARVDEGSYGRCETCGQPVGTARLAARPDARTCIACARS